MSTASTRSTSPSGPVRAAGLALDAENPWPGLEAFDEAGRLFFRGRNGEIEQLLRRVNDSPLTVLFGKSGLGKTSLLKAGLFPKLREKNFLPVYVRLQVRLNAPSLVCQIRDCLRTEFATEGIDAPAIAENEELWTYLHRADMECWNRRNFMVTPLFVLDQFEEIFTLAEGMGDAIAKFRGEIGDLIENRIPESLKAAFAQDAAGRFQLRVMRYKFLISLREDFLPELESWRGAIPSLGKVRLRLRPLRPGQALEAVHEAAPQIVDAQTAQRIVDFVAAAPMQEIETRLSASKPANPSNSDALGELEPALLSLFCHGLNERRKLLGRARIDIALVEGAKQNIIADYYRSCFEGMPEAVPRFVESMLITERGFRNSFAKDDAVPSQLAEEHLQLLVNRRLVRIGESYGAQRIELTHDLLTGVVRENRDQHREDDERAQLARRAEEDRKELERRLEQRRRENRWLLSLCVVSLLGCIALAALLVRGSQIDKAERALLKQGLEMNQLRARNEAQSIPSETGKLSDRLLHPVAAYQLMSGDPDAAGKRAAEANLQRALHRHSRVSGFLEGHRDLVLSVEFSSSGDYLASSSADGSIIIWDMASRRARPYSLAGHRGEVWSLAFSPDERVLASAGSDKEIRLWDVATGAGRGAPLAGHTEQIRALAFSPGGEFLASGGWDASVRFWSLRTDSPAVVATVPSHRPVVSLAYSADGELLAVGTDIGKIYLWNITTKSWLKEDLPGHAAGTFGLAFRAQSDKESRILASGGGDNSVAVWELGKDEVREIGRKWSDDLVSSVSFSADGSRVAAASWDHSISLYSYKDDFETDGRSELPLRVHRGAVHGVRFNPRNSSMLASAGSDHTVILWDIGPRSPVAETLGFHQSDVRAVASNGQYMVSGARDRNIFVWDVRTRKRLREFKGEHDNMITGVAFNPTDPNLLATADWSGKVLFWHMDSMEKIGDQIFIERDAIQDIAFSPDGKILASAHYGGAIRLWRVESRTPFTYPLVGHTTPVTSIAFNPKGTLLASSDENGKLLLWDLGTYKSSALPDKHVGAISKIAFSADGRLLVSAGKDHSMWVWDTQTHVPLRELLPGHRDRVVGLAVNPKNGTLASASRDRSILIWNLDEFRRLGPPLYGHEGPVTTVSFDAEGMLSSGGQDRAVVVWSLDQGAADWQSTACKIANRDLTEKEWGDLLPSLRDRYRKVCSTFSQGK